MEENKDQDLQALPLYVRAHELAPIRRLAPKMNRNDICPIENKKFKKCCGKDGANFCKKLLHDYLNKLQNQE